MAIFNSIFQLWVQKQPHVFQSWRIQRQVHGSFLDLLTMKSLNLVELLGGARGWDMRPL